MCHIKVLDNCLRRNTHKLYNVKVTSFGRTAFSYSAAQPPFDINFDLYLYNDVKIHINSAENIVFITNNHGYLLENVSILKSIKHGKGGEG